MQAIDLRESYYLLMTIKLIRVQTKDQREKAYQVRLNVFVQEQQIDESLELDEFEDDCLHLLALDGKTPVGAGRVRRKDNFLKCERICVLKSYRGRGVGRLIMEESENIAREWKIKSLILSAQVQAESFYNKCGYSRVSDRIYDDAGIPHLDMAKSIV